MNFESPGSGKREVFLEGEKIEKLKESLKEVALGLRKSGFPVYDNCRIDMNAFRKVVYDDKVVNQHLSTVEDLQNRWKEERQDSRRMDQRPDWRMSGFGRDANSQTDRENKSGEQLEMLKTVIFHKFLGKDFHTLRTSTYDDYRNGVDNLIIEKETGNIVGAFDEVLDSPIGERSEEKKEKIFKRNRDKGGLIRYAFKVVNDGSVRLERSRNLRENYLTASFRR